MKISIITPSFNAEKYIKDCINSVQNQTYTFIEHIIIDNCSTDDTINIIYKSNHNHPIYLYSESDTGQGDAVMKGVSKCSGDIIMWLNADDMLFSPHVCSRVIQEFKNPSVDVVYGGVLFFKQNSDFSRYVPPLKVNFNMLRYIAYIGNSNVFIKKNHLVNYPIDITLHFVIDHEWILRLVKHNLNFKKIKYPFTKFRYHQYTKTSIYSEVFKNSERVIRDSKFGQKYLYAKIFYRVIFFIVTFSSRFKKLQHFYNLDIN